MTVVVVLCVCPLVASVCLFCKTTFAYKQGPCDTDTVVFIQVAIFNLKVQACPAHTLRGLRRRQWLSSASVNRTTRCARLTPPTRKPGVIRKQVAKVARGHLLCVVLRAWADGPAGWDAPGMWLPRRHSSAVPGRRSQALSTAAGARVGRDEDLALVALGALVHGRHALGRLVEVDDESPARWLCEAHRDGGVC